MSIREEFGHCRWERNKVVTGILEARSYLQEPNHADGTERDHGSGLVSHERKMPPRVVDS
jgi:hypothetical protein